MTASVTDMPQRPAKIADRPEALALLQVTVALAVVIALVFGAMRMHVTTGPGAELSDDAPEVDVIGG